MRGAELRKWIGELRSERIRLRICRRYVALLIESYFDRANCVLLLLDNVIVEQTGCVPGDLDDAAGKWCASEIEILVSHAILNLQSRRVGVQIQSESVVLVSGNHARRNLAGTDDRGRIAIAIGTEDSEQDRPGSRSAALVAGQVEKETAGTVVGTGQRHCRHAVYLNRRRAG